MVRRIIENFCSLCSILRQIDQNHPNLDDYRDSQKKSSIFGTGPYLTIHHEFYIHACFSSLNAGESSESSQSEDDDQVRGKKFQAVTCTGRQPGSSIFVFGPTLHMNEMGDLIPRELQEYIWVPRILQLLHRVVNPLTTLPDPGVENPLKYVIEGLQNIAGENALSGIFLLGM